MNVGKTNSDPIQPLNQPSEAPRAGKAAESSPSAAPGDETQISRLSSYLAAAISGSPAHLSKLNALATAVSSGAYHVDSAVLSDRIIGQSLAFGAAW